MIRPYSNSCSGTEYGGRSQDPKSGASWFNRRVCTVFFLGKIVYFDFIVVKTIFDSDTLGLMPTDWSLNELSS